MRYTKEEFIIIIKLQKKLFPKLCLYNIDLGKGKRAYYLGIKGFGVMLCDLTEQEYLEFREIGLK